MTNMFHKYYCLKLINYENSNTSSVKKEYLFYGCEKLTSFYLTSFNNSLVITMKNMFINCVNLISLYLSTYDTYALEIIIIFLIILHH